ncbi:Por secretion system C-terminal sorting domain-containing protein [Hymenobacter daecheongensis DSM 21074]|uniref:Por secretion system C-terminal sorting domain-containing protein n=1 Tax=Hymenobacter daecheongensis DSM 21074 TaxID=1121955 RepID=A0A1M6EDM2_9BACT|nr:T9SS type A sorting domain-containing protein [Hymenobacter daecheongensis]SHI83576.1 Por secretion system C-terminal sorting domain-containing protein [Hymenobacter daecheongensis DSM 21074]
MKKTLLSLALLCSMSFAAQAQWTLLNTSAGLPPDYISAQTHTVSDQIAWSLIRENAAGSTINLFTRTIDGGANFTFSSINGAAGYQGASIHALDANTAFVAQFGGNGGGEVVKTVNGGNSWTKSTALSQFAAPAGFANWVYFFDANNGVSLGDPNGGYFEIYTTSNGGTSWTRVPRTPVLNELSGGEFGLVGSYFALGNTIWSGTIHLQNPADQTTGIPARILKSTDRGLTWTSSAITPISGSISKIAFTDQNNGIAYNTNAAGVTTLIATTDGGATWQTKNYTGKFNHFDIDAVPGTNILVSVGSSEPTVATAADYGSSYSTNNGQSWTNIDRGRYYSTVDFISRTVGYVGARTDANGAGGVYKATATALASRNAELQKDLSVYPNPSASGVFSLQLTSGIKAGTTVRVFDALGRQVLTQTLNGTTVAAQRSTIDLSKEKAGLYTLELRTENGVAQQKLVVE